MQISGFRNLFTRTHHPQKNGQVERFNRTILANIREFCSENPKSWPENAGPLTCAHNNQIHSSTGASPFSLVLSRPKTSVVVRKDPDSTCDQQPRENLTRFRKLASELAEKSRCRLKYKANFDLNVRQSGLIAKKGQWVFITREHSLRAHSGDNLRKGKLLRIASGPIGVVDSDSHTVTILREYKEIGLVPRDRISVA